MSTLVKYVPLRTYVEECNCVTVTVFIEHEKARG